MSQELPASVASSSSFVEARGDINPQRPQLPPMPVVSSNPDVMLLHAQLKKLQDKRILIESIMKSESKGGRNSGRRVFGGLKERDLII